MCQRSCLRKRWGITLMYKGDNIHREKERQRERACQNHQCQRSCCLRRMTLKDEHNRVSQQQEQQDGPKKRELTELRRAACGQKSSRLQTRSPGNDNDHTTHTSSRKHCCYSVLLTSSHAQKGGALVTKV